MKRGYGHGLPSRSTFQVDEDYTDTLLPSTMLTPLGQQQKRSRLCGHGCNTLIRKIDGRWTEEGTGQPHTLKRCTEVLAKKRGGTKKV